MFLHPLIFGIKKMPSRFIFRQIFLALQINLTIRKINQD
jgi:hypothetical protein